MLDERRKTRGERTGETLQMKYERKNVIASITKQSIIILSVSAFFSACTDYASEMEDDFEEWKKTSSVIEPDESSSSVAESVSSEKVFRPYKALNPMPNGNCRTIKNQYFKNSIANFLSTGSFGATGVIRKIER